LLCLADEGIADFELDNRGINIETGFEVGNDRLEKIISLRKVEVKIHYLNYTLKKIQILMLDMAFQTLSLAYHTQSPRTPTERYRRGWIARRESRICS